MFWELVSLNLIDERDQAPAAAVLLFLFCRFLFFSLSANVFTVSASSISRMLASWCAHSLCVYVFCIPNYFLFQSKGTSLSAQRSNICVWTN